MLGQTTNGYVTVGPTVAARPATSTRQRADGRYPGERRDRGARRRGDARRRLQGRRRVGRAPDHRRHRLLPARRRRGVVRAARPARVLDTRDAATGCSTCSPRACPARSRSPVVGAVPGGVVGVTGNVTVVNQTSAGYVSVGPAVAGRTDHVDDQRPARRHPRQRRDGRRSTAPAAWPPCSGAARARTTPRTTRATTTPGRCSSAIRDAEVAYPGIVDVFAVGKSYQGRPIWAAKVSDNVDDDENEPEVLFDALHHAREHLTIEQILDTFGQLDVALRHDDAHPNIVNAREVWFIFALNPDGWAYDLGGSPYRGWRKNRQPNAATARPQPQLRLSLGLLRRLVGVDRAPGTTAVRSAFSAPETRVVRDFVNSRVKGGKQQIKSAISFHTNGELILWPYGYTFTNIPSDMRSDDHRVFVALGRGHGQPQRLHRPAVERPVQDRRRLHRLDVRPAPDLRLHHRAVSTRDGRQADRPRAARRGHRGAERAQPRGDALLPGVVRAVRTRSSARAADGGGSVQRPARIARYRARSSGSRCSMA